MRSVFRDRIIDIKSIRVESVKSYLVTNSEFGKMVPNPDDVQKVINYLRYVRDKDNIVDASSHSSCRRKTWSDDNTVSSLHICFNENIACPTKAKMRLSL